MEEITKKECYTEAEIMQEIAPIFKDYFIARFRKNGNVLFMKLTNGQLFSVSVVKEN